MGSVGMILLKLAGTIKVAFLCEVGIFGKRERSSRAT